MEKMLPAIPAKRYFTIGEVSDLCGVKPYVLRYWEQEFTQLKPMKRRGNRRYYQHHEVLLIRRIRELLYDQGFTISGARNRLADALNGLRQASAADVGSRCGRRGRRQRMAQPLKPRTSPARVPRQLQRSRRTWRPAGLRSELLSIRDLLTV
jgi:DNA-binding transcriptional MerR regulator